MTVIQRFGSALNLNIHLLVLDGVYVRSHERLEFQRVPPPTNADLEQLLNTIATRVGRHLQRQGWLTRDAEGSQLTVDREGTALYSLLSHSITYRIALGPRAGHKAFTLRSLPGQPLPAATRPFLATAEGFSLHAGVAADRKKVEQLCRYLARPVSDSRPVEIAERRGVDGCAGGGPRCKNPGIAGGFTGRGAAQVRDWCTLRA